MSEQNAHRGSEGEQGQFKNSPCDVYCVQRPSHTIIHKQAEEKQSRMK